MNDHAERALARLDALLPAHEPLDALAEWVRQLREVGITKATASHGITALCGSGLVDLRSDGALLNRSLPL